MRLWLTALCLLGCGTADPPEVVRAAPGPVPDPAVESAPAMEPPSDHEQEPEIERTWPGRVEACDLPTPRVGALREGLRYAPGRHLDLALPASEGPHPWVVLIHGGGWSAGERGHLRREMEMLATLGFAAASVDYRLLDAGRPNRWPVQVADVRCAVRYLRRRAGSLGLDPERGAALGFSAGGYLAEMLGTASDVEGLDHACPDTETSPAVRAVVAYYAPADLRPEASYSRAADAILTRFLGAPRARVPERAALASPVVHVDAADPPHLLLHGTRDTVVPLDQSERMRDALEAAGVHAQLVVVDGAPHGFRLFWRGERTRPATCTTVAFLEAALRSPRGASRSAGASGSRP